MSNLKGKIGKKLTEDPCGIRHRIEDEQHMMVGRLVLFVCYKEVRILLL